jgi:hypothetical protein
VGPGSAAIVLWLALGLIVWLIVGFLAPIAGMAFR